jgi:prephenate dehydrogenase
MRIAVIGVGLIGGSVALAARKRLGAFVAAYDADPAALRHAQRRGAIDRSCDSIQEAVADAEIAFVAVPVGAQREALAAVLAAAPADCVVSDVGSTKRAIVAQIDDQRFVGGHPLAGAETSGIEHARADLFEGAAWYLTPTQRTAGVCYETLHRVLCAFGAMPSAIDADTHDTILALVSHLPHVLANVLVSQAAATLAAGGERLPATGPSFRDATRVAGASSAIWIDIYLSNRDTLVAQIDETIRRLDGVRALLVAGEGEPIARWNDAAATNRRLLLDGQLDRGELCELRASVPNRPGVVAELALALGRAGVNILDMALYPAADMTEGVVALWIAGAGTAARAQQIIHDLGFPVARA